MIKLRSGACRCFAEGRVARTSFRNDAPVVIGLVNNMPDAALQATERQFCDLLAEASRDPPGVGEIFFDAATSALRSGSRIYQPAL